MLADRITHLAETNGWLSSYQAGFRRGRSCEDQILRMVQAIEDGFQKPKMERSVLVLLDFSAAFDTVWRQKLLLTMLNTGVPHAYVKWLFHFLNNRQARVKFNGAISNSRKLHQGLPQGSVLSPPLLSSRRPTQTVCLLTMSPSWRRIASCKALLTRSKQLWILSLNGARAGSSI